MAAVEAYTRQCMKSRAGAASGDDGTQLQMSGSGRGAGRASRIDEQFAQLELMNGRESRPNNLVCSTQDVLPSKSGCELMWGRGSLAPLLNFQPFSAFYIFCPRESIKPPGLVSGHKY